MGICFFCGGDLDPLKMKIGGGKRKDLDVLVTRHAEVIEELKNMRERRADALRIAEERRAEIQRLKAIIERAMEPIHILRGREIGYADDVLDEVADILEEE